MKPTDPIAASSDSPAPALEDRASVERDALTARLVKAYSGLPPDRVPMLLQMCAKYGINPDPEAVPRELLGVRAGGDPRFFEELFCVIVSAGGQKLREPMDQDTEDRLRRIFHAWKIERDPRTKEEWRVDLPLPDDLRLPAPARTGIPVTKPGTWQA